MANMKLRRFAKFALIALAIAVALPHIMIFALRWINPPGSMLMVSRLIDGHGLERHWRPIGAIAPTLGPQVLASEDNRFCMHGGVDWEEFWKVFRRYRDGDAVRGASTVTMQLARNLFLWQGRDPLRKGAEVWLALVMDAWLPKKRIMEIYLNTVEWGPGLYGAEATAQRYFGKPASRLSATETSLMAAALPAPLQWNAGRPTAYLAERAATIRQRVQQLGGWGDCVR